jgi:hypothetical protein
MKKSKNFSPCQNHKDSYFGMKFIFVDVRTWSRCKLREDYYKAITPS